MEMTENENEKMMNGCLGDGSLSKQEILDIQRYRMVLEVGFMNRHWNRITEEDIDALTQVTQKPDECDVFYHWDHNSRFHLRLMQCYGDPYALKKLEEALADQQPAFVRERLKLWKKPAFSERPLIHEEIIDAIRDGRKLLACKLLEADIRTM